ncbi:MAG: methyl-accepting chemotaxis protein, partial [Rubrivivax sp.]
MKLENISVARKLWVSTLVVLLAMTAAALVSQRFASLAMLDGIAELHTYEDRITVATRWKGSTETNTQRVVALALSQEPLVTQTFAPLLKAGIEGISELQKKIVAEATSEADKAALAVVGERRTVVLGLTKKLDTMKAGNDAAATRAVVDNELMPAVATYLGAIDEFLA